MKLDKLIYSIREAFSAYSDDSELSNKYINFLLDINRAKYIKQRLSNFATTIDNNIIQTFCIEVEPASSIECIEGIDCNNLLRTIKKIPKTFLTATRNSIISVSPVDRLSEKFSIIDKNRLPFLKFSKFSNKIYAFLDSDDYLYLYSTSNTLNLLSCISISGVFESPNDLNNFKKCCNCDESSDNICFTYDSEYPIQSELIDVIRKDVLNEILFKYKIVEDTNNNAANG